LGCKVVLLKRITDICSEIHAKYANTLCEQNVEFVNLKPGGTQTDQGASNAAFIRTGNLLNELNEKGVQHAAVYTFLSWDGGLDNPWFDSTQG
jgi:hypothetical protein